MGGQDRYLSRKERPFWAVDKTDGTGDYSAHIISGTNTFVDTSGKEIHFRFCPMCGRPLDDPPDDSGGRVIGLIPRLINRSLTIRSV